MLMPWTLKELKNTRSMGHIVLIFHGTIWIMDHVFISAFSEEYEHTQHRLGWQVGAPL